MPTTCRRGEWCTYHDTIILVNPLASASPPSSIRLILVYLSSRQQRGWTWMNGTSHFPGGMFRCIMRYINRRQYTMTRWSHSFVCTSHQLIFIIMQTYLKVLEFYNACQVHYLSSVCLRLSQFSRISFVQYIGVCVVSLSISLMMIVRIRVLYFIIIIKSEVWPIYHCLRFDNETMVCAVCLIFIFLQTEHYFSEWF